MALIRACEPASAYVKEKDRIAAMATKRRAHRPANFMYVDRTRSLGLLMSFDVPATPVEIVKVGHSALRNGTRSVPQELFGLPRFTN